MKTYIEPTEIALLEQATTNLRDQLLVRLLFHTGCRVTEAITLTVQDIDIVNGLVAIRHLKTRLSLSCPDCGTRLGRSHTFCPRCGSKVSDAVARELEHRRQRILPIDPETLDMLGEYIRRGGPVERNGRKLIFAINRHRAWQIIKKSAEKAGLPKLMNPGTGKMHNVSPHRLRDAFSVMAIKKNDSGDGLRLLQEHLGHQSITTTMKYRKVSGKEHLEWYQKLW